MNAATPAAMKASSPSSTTGRRVRTNANKERNTAGPLSVRGDEVEVAQEQTLVARDFFTRIQALRDLHQAVLHQTGLDHAALEAHAIGAPTRITKLASIWALSRCCGSATSARTVRRWVAGSATSPM